MSDVQQGDESLRMLKRCCDTLLYTFTYYDLNLGLSFRSLVASNRIFAIGWNSSKLDHIEFSDEENAIQLFYVEKRAFWDKPQI